MLKAPRLHLYIYCIDMRVVSTFSERKQINCISKNVKLFLYILPKAVMYCPPTGQWGYHVCCCSWLAVSCFITKRGLITFCRNNVKWYVETHDKRKLSTCCHFIVTSWHLFRWIFFHTVQFVLRFLVVIYAHEWHINDVLAFGHRETSHLPF